MQDLRMNLVGIQIEEADGSPSGFAQKIKFPNGTLTDNGDGSFTYNPEDITLDDITVDTISAVADDLITIKDNLLLDKRGTATADTQYQSEELRLRGSVWDTDNTQAEDRTWKFRVNAASGGDGSEPNYLDILDNDDNIALQLDPINDRVSFYYSIFASSQDGNTGIVWDHDDGLTIKAGNVVMIELDETTQDVLKLGNDGDVDVYIGPGGKGLMVRGSDALIQLQNSGYQFFYNETQNLADDGFIDLPNTSGGWAMIGFDNFAEYAFVAFNSGSAVTGISDSSSNINYADTDAKYCVFDNGSNVRVRNRIGSQKRVTIIAFCR